jgi:hypothetical protein
MAKRKKPNPTVLAPVSAVVSIPIQTPQQLQPEISVQVIAPAKTQALVSWRASIESTCKTIIAIFATLALPVFLIGQSYRKGFLHFFGAYEVDFPHDVTQQSLELTNALPHFIGRAFLGFMKQPFWDKFGVSLLVIFLAFLIYGILKIIHLRNHNDPPAESVKVVKKVSELKQFSVFSVVIIAASVSPYILAAVMVVVVTLILQFVYIFQDLGYERANLLTSEIKTQLQSTSEKNQPNLRRIYVAGDARLSASVECGQALCIVVAVDPVGNAVTTHIVARAEITTVERKFNDGKK